MKLQKQYFPEGEDNGAVVETPAEVVEQTPAEITAAAEVAAKEDLQPIDTSAAEALFKEEGVIESEKEVVNPAEPAKPADTEKQTEEEPAAEFVLKTEATDKTEPTEITSWKDLGTVLDFEVADDSEEGVKTAYKAHLDAKIAEAVEAAKNTTLEKELAAVDPEAQMLFDFVKTGGKIEDFVEPLKPFEKMIAMSDEALVREAEKLRKTPDAEIDEKVIELVDNGKLEEEAKKIRDYVSAEKVKFQGEIVQKRKDAFAKTYKAENESIKSALEQVENILDIPLKKEIREGLAAKIPTYRERFKNEPQLVARAIALLELGDQAKGLIHKKGYEEAKSKLNKKIFNLEDIPSRSNGAARRTENGGGETLAEQYAAKLKEERAEQ